MLNLVKNRYMLLNGLLLWMGATALISCSPAPPQQGGHPGTKGVVPKDTPIGFDPGLSKRLAATIDPTQSFYFESCPDSTTGKCNGSIPAGGGFYTLSMAGGDAVYVGSKCKVNSAEIFDQGVENRGVPCPHYFEWLERIQGRVGARVIEDSHGFKSTAWNYFGLQLNTFQTAGAAPGSTAYTGLDLTNPQHAPKISTLSKVSFRFRANTCWREEDVNRYGRIVYYLGWTWEAKGRGGMYQLSIDIGQFKKTNFTPRALVQRAARESDLMDNPVPPDTVPQGFIIHINAAAFGILPNVDVPSFYPAPGQACDPAAIAALPYRDVSIPVRAIILQLIEEGFIERISYETGIYNVGVVMGLETWGRTRTTADIRNHVMWRDQ